MNSPSRARARLNRVWLGVSTSRELASAMVEGGRWWLLPMLLLLGVTALLLGVVAAIEYGAPFVYTVF